MKTPKPRTSPRSALRFSQLTARNRVIQLRLWARRIVAELDGLVKCTEVTDSLSDGGVEPAAVRVSWNDIWKASVPEFADAINQVGAATAPPAAPRRGSGSKPARGTRGSERAFEKAVKEGGFSDGTILEMDRLHGIIPPSARSKKPRSQKR